MRHAFRYSAAVLAAVLVLSVTSAALAGIEGKYRVEMMNGKVVEGDLKELPDGSYQVKTGNGITITIKKNQVRKLTSLEQPAEPKTPTPGAATNTKTTPTKDTDPYARREISDQEIQEVLSGITADMNAEEGMGGDLMAELPLNEESLKEMLTNMNATRDDNVLTTPHFVMVYNSTPESARELGARLESVYRWNARFMEMMKIPARRPEHKMELYYFGTFDEYDAYSRNHGMDTHGGAVLGYYTPEINRAHFFNLETMPGLKEFLEQLKQPVLPWKIRQYVTNRIKRTVEYYNCEVIQHETGHMIHFNIGLFPKDGLEREASVPLWLVEGTTMLFEVPPNSAGASLGTLNHTRLFQLRAMFGFHPLDASRWKLVIIDNSYWFGAGGWNVGQSYQLGWAMVYYLWEKKRDGYAKYLQKVFGREEAMDRTALEREFNECFGPIDEKFVKNFYAFLDTLEVKPSSVNPMHEEEARVQNVQRYEMRHINKAETAGASESSPPPADGGRGRRPR